MTRAVDVDVLPTDVYSDDLDLVISHGYVASVTHDGAAGGNLLTFFVDLEPALVFGRAARQSQQSSGYGVYRGALERRFVPGIGYVVTTYITGPSLDRVDGEQVAFARWAAGTRLKSAAWHVPGASI